jgi:hypothetical protein
MGCSDTPLRSHMQSIYLFIYSFFNLTACSGGTSRWSHWQAFVKIDQPVLPFDIIIIIIIIIIFIIIVIYLARF